MRPTAVFIQGDARHLPLADESVQCVVTSPPYFGLRDYGLPPSVWGGDPACEHEWEDTPRTYGGGPQGATGQRAGRTYTAHGVVMTGLCSHCSAWRGVLGLEPTVDLYVQHLVEVFREVRRVLRSDGTLWLNLGDSFNNSNGFSRATNSWGRDGRVSGSADKRAVGSLKVKDLVGVPWRVAFALQANGWYLRSCLPWLKRNPVPESVQDRPTTAHEFVFLLSKSASYFYDSFAVRCRGSSGHSDLKKMELSQPRLGGKHKGLDDPHSKASATTKIGTTRAVGSPIRQWRTTDAWMDSLRDLLNGGEGLVSGEDGEPLALLINTEPFPGMHFAVFPRSLAAPMLLAGTSERGACVTCGAPWERMLEKATRPSVDPSDIDRFGTGDAGVHRKVGQTYQDFLVANPDKTVGWRPTCACGTEEVRPCVTLDPFAGAGTAPMVAKELGRVGIGVELKEEYLWMAAKRTRQEVLL